MAQEYAISAANLAVIEGNLQSINRKIEVIDTNLDTVNGNVATVYAELQQLSEEFHTYVADELRRWELENATTNIGNVRQELQTHFGHYADVRRSAVGILQATDLGIVRKTTISTTTENFTLTCPGYWLAPALVALAAWIDNDQDVAQKSIRAAIERDDEKTSLMFALVTRRAKRMDAALNWVVRYLDNQDPENLGREAIVIIDAYSAGLFAYSAEGEIEAKLEEWLKHLSSQPGFIETQTSNWKTALNGKRNTLGASSYQYLRSYSPTWPVLQDVMEGAHLHRTVMEYFKQIFETPNSTEAIIRQLDSLLSSLVTDFDEEELPLRTKERYYQLVIDHDGDKTRAQAELDLEKSALEEHRSFTQVLTDAAMNPDLAKASVSGQKFAIAYSRDWVFNAYSDLVAENRAKVPNAIEIAIDTFSCQTTDASNQVQLEANFDAHIDNEKQSAHAQNTMSFAESYGLPVGIALLVLAFVLFFFMPVVAVFALAGGIFLTYKGATGKKKHAEREKKIDEEYEQKRESGKQILRATCAEIVDFRSEFNERDSEAQFVLDFLESLTPEEFIQANAEAPRKTIKETR